MSLRLASLNLASGRDANGVQLGTDAVAAGLRDLADVDVLALQEVDLDQPRSHGVDQTALAARVLGAAAAGFAPALVGTPGVPGWTASDPVVLQPPVQTDGAPRYGVALVSRRPVRRWHVLRMASGPGRLPLPVPHPVSGRMGVRVFPDEPRVALAAELDDVTVVSTHLSFWTPTAVRQLCQVRRWVATLPGPVVVAGDLNLPGSWPARLLSATPMVSGPTFPSSRPVVQLDHLLLLGAGSVTDAAVLPLDVSDHRALTARLHPPIG